MNPRFQYFSTSSIPFLLLCLVTATESAVDDTPRKKHVRYNVIALVPSFVSPPRIIVYAACRRSYREELRVKVKGKNENL
ncbi:hypothetical protein AXX17_AT4G10340 [Arabidopsis thaliana]|uniref:Transmembrane protein n=1 Tax=Arabidopsis thaliana TaxID=3702 RepID=A0A178UV54_ARATH|nr:hypothetical protein AXX17_AT4G10340 [Arabidopsis thaliana]